MNMEASWWRLPPGGFAGGVEEAIAGGILVAEGMMGCGLFFGAASQQNLCLEESRGRGGTGGHISALWMNQVGR